MSPRALFSRLKAEESGFTIIEVLVSSLVMVVIAVGVFKSLDTASARSGYQKDKGVAAGLAQQDQERLRAFTIQELNNYVQTRCLQKQTTGFVKDPECDNSLAQGPIYKVISRTDWVSDQSGTRSCGTGARSDYIRISSTVSWANPSGTSETGANRVSVASLVAPRVGSFGDDGSLSIEVRDRNGTGRANVPVAVTGPKSLSGTTDANGCLFFGYLPQGNYTVAVTQSGNVDSNGNANISQQFGVNPAAITAAVIEYDVGANLNVSFSTRKAGATVAGQKADQVSIGHSSLASPTWRSYDSNEPATARRRPMGLERRTRRCCSRSPTATASTAATAPATARASTAWGRPRAGRTANTFATLSPGGTSNITVHEPSVLLTPGAGWPGGQIPTGALVILRPETTWGGSPTMCSDPKYFWTHDDASSGTGAWLKNIFEPSLDPNAAGPHDFGVPVGAYDVCVMYPITGSVRYRWLTDSEANASGNGVRPLDNGPTAANAALSVPLPATDPNNDGIPGSSSCP